MVSLRWVPVSATVVTLAVLATPALADGPPTPDSATTPVISQQIWVQPVLPTESDIDTTRMKAILDRVASWARSTSSDSWKIGWGGKKSDIDVPGRDCSTLVREVALDRQLEHDDAAVTVYVGQANDCPYLGQAMTPGSWVLLPHLRARDDATARTLAHELGHTLGLLHAGAETCAILRTSPAERSDHCVVSEYGDYTDPMGRGSLDWSLGPITRTASGWLDLPDVSGDGTRVIRLGAEEGVRIIDPVSGTAYVVAHRRPGPDAAERSTGIHVYRLPHADEQEVSSVHLPWIATPSRPWAGQKGMAFISPSGAVALEVRSTSKGFTQLAISIDSDAKITDTWGPVFAESQPQITWRGKSAIVRVPRAFDQSGVMRYQVSVNGRVIATHRMQPRIESWSLRLNRREAHARTISVEAIDSAGNRTTVMLDPRDSAR